MRISLLRLSVTALRCQSAPPLNPACARRAEYLEGQYGGGNGGGLSSQLRFFGTRIQGMDP